MNILVIGNGFDLAHNLPTKYGDFLLFIKCFKEYTHTQSLPEVIAHENERAFYAFSDHLNQTNPELYNEMKTLTDGNVWLDYFISIFESRNKEGKDGWIDFESEIALIVQTLDECRETLLGQFEAGKDLGKLEAWQFKRLKPLFFCDESDKAYESHEFSPLFLYCSKKRLLDALNNLIRCLEIYLGEYVQSLPISQLKDIENLQIDNVLSFNYTNTAERLYARKDGKSLDFDYIHGKANVHGSVEECNLVLGIDEYLPVGKKDSDNEYIEFKKFYQRIYKATGSHYIDWVDQYRENRQRFKKGPVSQMNIYIYGHSLDVTDKDILRNLILEEGTVTTVYYYDKNDLGKKIANLVKVIGEAELIKRTDGRRATIIFQETAK